MAPQASQVRGVMSAEEPQPLTAKKVDRICGHLDELNSHWARLEIGDSMAVRWPDLAVSGSASALTPEARGDSA